MYKKNFICFFSFFNITTDIFKNRFVARIYGSYIFIRSHCLRNTYHMYFLTFYKIEQKGKGYIFGDKFERTVAF